MKWSDPAIRAWCSTSDKRAVIENDFYQWRNNT